MVRIPSGQISRVAAKRVTSCPPVNSPSSSTLIRWNRSVTIPLIGKARDVPPSGERAMKAKPMAGLLGTQLNVPCSTGKRPLLRVYRPWNPTLSESKANRMTRTFVGSSNQR